MAQATTPTELADRLEVNAKTLRAFLRQKFPRELDAKNTRWSISKTMEKAAEKHFASEENPAQSQTA